ncbi:asparagine synthase family protein [Mycobacterium kansasii]|uniref:Asparagine synthase family protein n=1 Tax=Mycobacterium kansasii TaxID=1768 RepID=A0A1V3WXX9_MYCKA|nr:asparagine synthase family protein [Mycobacterium kansasii]
MASAEAIGARHVAKVVSAEEFVAALPEIVWYLDEPVADPALVPLFFVAREARKYVKVVLSGKAPTNCSAATRSTASRCR